VVETEPQASETVVGKVDAVEVLLAKRGLV
jgi:hypothetical protein